LLLDLKKLLTLILQLVDLHFLLVVAVLDLRLLLLDVQPLVLSRLLLTLLLKRVVLLLRGVPIRILAVRDDVQRVRILSRNIDDPHRRLVQLDHWVLVVDLSLLVQSTRSLEHGLLLYLGIDGRVRYARPLQLTCVLGVVLHSVPLLHGLLISGLTLGLLAYQRQRSLPLSLIALVEVD
jgi:hypothetical protein